MARILVIDDDNDIAALVGLKLELDGHTVTLAGDGLSGLARLRQDPPDVLIVDWTLPGLTGPEICAAMRDDADLRDIWVIMLTARPLDDMTLTQSGADEVVPKPFSPRHLSERVSSALAR
jgi:DNA-binding response OmpR family regulator